MLVAVEGIDGSGKTTLVDNLCKFYESKNIKTAVFRFPTRDSTTGTLIDSVLKKEKKLEPLVLQYLFAANRLEMQPKIEEALKTHQIVILDRYSDSGPVYAGVQGIDPLLVRDLDKHIRPYNICFHLVASPEICVQRCKERSKSDVREEELFEKKSFQEKAAKMYLACYTDMTQTWTAVCRCPNTKIYFIDADQSESSVLNRTINYLEDHMSILHATKSRDTPSRDSDDSNSQ